MTVLHSARLAIHHLRFEDVPAYTQYNNDRRYRENMILPPPECTADAAIYWIEETAKAEPRAWLLGIYQQNGKDMAETTLVGDILIAPKRENKSEAEIAYGIAPDQWGKGYMTEALSIVVPHLHQAMNFKTVTAMVCADNPASWRALEKARFQRMDSVEKPWNGQIVKTCFNYLSRP